MKIQIISDLHQEFGFMNLRFDGADLVVLAGDVNLGTKGIEWIKSVITDIPVIYVLGNHEYYKGSYPKTLNAIKQFSINFLLISSQIQPTMTFQKVLDHFLRSRLFRM